jgi:hypothetical protein
MPVICKAKQASKQASGKEGQELKGANPTRPTKIKRSKAVSVRFVAKSDTTPPRQREVRRDGLS